MKRALNHQPATVGGLTCDSDCPTAGVPGRFRLGGSVGAARTAPPGSRLNAAGFTMVEIALCLAIIGFALVAIIGVLPTGLKVQKENRDETIILQEGRYWIEVLRSGALLEEVTNNIESITISNLTSRTFAQYTPSDSIPGTLTRGAYVIGRLSTPRHQTLANGRVITNQVVARVRSLAGSAADKDPANRDFAFRYELGVEITPLQLFAPESLRAPTTTPPNLLDPFVANYLVATNVSANFHEIRLTLRWPMNRTGTGYTVAGNNERVFRTLVSGRLFAQDVNGLGSLNRLFFLQPSQFTQISPRTQP